MVPGQNVHCYNYSVGGISYEWNFGDTTSTEQEPIHEYMEPGVYDISLVVWSEFECFDTITMVRAVIAEEAGTIYFPDAFTPNPTGATGGAYPCGYGNGEYDHSNDIFHPVYGGVSEYKMEIYNRWGERIYVSEEVCVGWDGYVDGVLAPQDVYVWKATGRYKNGEPFTKVGSLTLLR